MSNEDYIRKNAIIYQRYKDQFDQIEWVELNQFRLEITQAFETIPCVVFYVDRQPYKDHHELTADIKAGRMLISKDHNNSKLLPGELNLKFRAVHDYLHYVLQAPFTAVGEIKVYGTQKKLHCSPIGQKILFSEVVLQACYAEYFGTFGKQKVILL